MRSHPHIHLVNPLDEDSHLPKGLKRVRVLANLMDAAITLPILRKKIGLDPILGVCPVVGDVITGLVATYTLYVGYQLGLPKIALFKMAGNLLLDTTVGNLPVVGDLFDWFWKANLRNLAILESEYAKIRMKQNQNIVPFPQQQPWQNGTSYSAQTHSEQPYTSHAAASQVIIDVDLKS